MNIREKYQQELLKISRVERSTKSIFKFSDILLFREYQTRLFIWKRAVNPDFVDAFNKSKEFHNLFVDIFPSGIADFIPEEAVINDLKINGIEDVYLTHRDYYGFFICMYINWEIFKNISEIKKYKGLPHPYETVFKMLLRGGFVFNSEKKIEIDNRTYLKYDNKFMLPNLDDKFLDFVDQSVSNFPNQEKVNQLWLEFNKQ